MHMKRVVVAMVLYLTLAAVSFAQSAPPPPPPPPPAPAGHSGPTRIAKGGDVMMATAIFRVPPEYPEAARKQRIQGTVRLYTLVGTDGLVMATKSISGPTELVQAAIDAVKQWRFRPTILKGEPVEVECVLELIFKLHK